jgi:hypothetical protein
VQEAAAFIKKSTVSLVLVMRQRFPVDCKIYFSVKREYKFHVDITAEHFHNLSVNFHNAVFFLLFRWWKGYGVDTRNLKLLEC